MVLLVGLAGSLLASRALERNEAAARVSLLASGLAQALEGLTHRLDELEATFSSLAVVAAAGPDPTAAEWEERVESVRALRNPGTQFLAWVPLKGGVLPRVSPSSRSDLMDQALAGPLPPSLMALLQTARQETDGAASAVLDLPASWGLPRSLVMAAFGRRNREARGWVVAFLNPREAFRGLMGSRPVAGVRFQILEAGATGPRALLYTSSASPRQELLPSEGPLIREGLLRQASLNWVLRMELIPSESAEGTTWPFHRRVLASGIAGTFICFLLTLFLARGRARMEDLAVRLHESEEGFRAMTEAATCMIVIYADRLEYINRAGAEVLGWRPEEMVGRSRLDFVHPLDREWVAQRWEARRRGEPVPDHYEFRILNRSGEARWVDFSATTITLRGATYGLGTALDITERVRAHEDRLQMERKLLDAQKLESLGLLAGGIAHDFNNLLAVIQGHAGILREREEGLAPGQAEESLAKIEETCRRAAELVRQMLAYSGRGRFQVEAMDLNKELEGIAHLLTVSLPKDVVLRFELGHHLPPVEADPSQVQQVVLNLVTNAAEAMVDGGGQISLRTGVKSMDAAAIAGLKAAEAMVPGRFLWLEVEDEGCGMDEATQARVFDPFFTTKFTGRGLGLAAMQGIVRGHQGGVSLQSTPGQGTRFRIYFPALEGSLPEATLLETQRAKFKGEGLVLVVDDEPAIRDLGRTLLERVGFQVILASDGFEALDLYRVHHGELALVLMDVVMPRMGGIEALHRMREFDAGVPVLMVSGYGQEEALAELEARGEVGFLSKPFSRQALMDAVAKLARKVESRA
ncbi:MAG: response regulator [Acidobacteria bacterium]|nr:response regulator [Acidobacteriota bacterium]